MDDFAEGIRAIAHKQAMEATDKKEDSDER